VGAIIQIFKLGINRSIVAKIEKNVARIINQCPIILGADYNVWIQKAHFYGRV